MIRKAFDRIDFVSLVKISLGLILTVACQQILLAL
jgi:hypothetical protein